MLKGDLKEAVNLLGQALKALTGNPDRKLQEDIQAFLNGIILKKSAPSRQKVELKVIREKPFHVQAVDLFGVEYLKKFGKPYAPISADFVRAAAVLRPFQLETLKKLYWVAWETPDRKDFSIASCSMTVKGFCSIINQLKLPMTAYEREQMAIRNVK